MASLFFSFSLSLSQASSLPSQQRSLEPSSLETLISACLPSQRVRPGTRRRQATKVARVFLKKPSLLLKHAFEGQLSGHDWHTPLLDAKIEKNWKFWRSTLIDSSNEQKSTQIRTTQVYIIRLSGLFPPAWKGSQTLLMHLGQCSMFLRRGLHPRQTLDESLRVHGEHPCAP